MLLLYGFLALCSLAGISADCGNFETIHYFDQSRFAGSWYENGMLDERRHSCVKFTWFATPHGELGINMSTFHLSRNEMFNESLRVRRYDKTQPGRFTMIFPYGMDETRWILGTDYTSYSVELSCSFREKPGVHIMTRKIDPPQSVIDKAMKVIRNHGITINKYATTDHSCWKPEEIIAEKEPKNPFSFEVEITV